MTDDMLAELLAVVGMANQTNALSSGFRVELDASFMEGGPACSETVFEARVTDDPLRTNASNRK